MDINQRQQLTTFPWDYWPTILAFKKNNNFFIWKKKTEFFEKKKKRSVLQKENSDYIRIGSSMLSKSDGVIDVAQSSGSREQVN